MQPSYSLIWATGSVPDVLVLLPCEQEPREGDDGYSSMRTHTRHVSTWEPPRQVENKRAWHVFFFTFSPVTSLVPHLFYAARVTSSDGTPDNLKWQEGIFHSNFTSLMSNAVAVLFSLKSGAKTFSKADESQSAWLTVYCLILIKTQGKCCTICSIFVNIIFKLFYWQLVINTRQSTKAKCIQALCNGWRDYLGCTALAI